MSGARSVAGEVQTEVAYHDPLFHLICCTAFAAYVTERAISSTSTVFFASSPLAASLSVLAMRVASSVQSNTRKSMSNPILLTRVRASSPFASRSVTEANGIIIGSTLGGTALILISVFLILFPIWRRRHHANNAEPVSRRSPNRLSDHSCPSPLSQPLPPPDTNSIRPVTPWPSCRLAVDAPAPQATEHVARQERHPGRASADAPSGSPRPTIVFRGDMFTDDYSLAPRRIHVVDGRHQQQHHHHQQQQHQQQQQQQLAQQQQQQHSCRYLGDAPSPHGNDAAADSISTAFAAEMSSLLESISLKSSHSSLRSGGGLGVPPRAQRAPAESERARGERSGTTVGATWGSVSEAGDGGAHSGSKPALDGLLQRPMTGDESREDYQGGVGGMRVTVGMGFDSG